MDAFQEIDDLGGRAYEPAVDALNTLTGADNFRIAHACNAAGVACVEIPVLADDNRWWLIVAGCWVLIFIGRSMVIAALEQAEGDDVLPRALGYGHAFFDTRYIWVAISLFSTLIIIGRAVTSTMSVDQLSDVGVIVSTGALYAARRQRRKRKSVIGRAVERLRSLAPSPAIA